MLEQPPIYLDEFKVALDSGAHTWYVQHFADHGGLRNAFNRYDNANYELLEGEEFKSYLESYIKFLLEHKDEYSFYVTLDIIGNPQKSWEITEYIESFGLTPMPVYQWSNSWDGDGNETYLTYIFFVGT